MELDLSDNAFGPDGVRGFEALLKSPACFTLHELKLNNCGMGIGGGKVGQGPPVVPPASTFIKVCASALGPPSSQRRKTSKTAACRKGVWEGGVAKQPFQVLVLTWQLRGSTAA